MIELRVETHNAFTVCGKKTWISGQDNDLFGCFGEEYGSTACIWDEISAIVCRPH